ncbi:MAG TPA: cold shock domain-containing protein [Acidimicrobiales bacterium]|jgi:cold shock CspA family protein
MPPFAVSSGVVVAFDDLAGHGLVRDDAGEEWFFHCTRIADGTRTIAVGAAVTFEAVAGPTRGWEASGLRPAPGA